MDKIKINNQNYFFPSSWSEITLEVFLQIRELESRKEDIQFMEFAMYYIHIVTGVDIEEIRSIKDEELITIMTKLRTLSDSNIELVGNPVFKYNNTWYVFDSKMIFGQFIDLNNITKDKEWWSISNEISAVFIREAKIKFSGKLKVARKLPLTVNDFKIDAYDFIKLKDRAEIFMKYLPMDQIYTCKAFFLTLRHHSEGIIQ